MLSSAMGRAWLAHASAAQRCAVLNQLRVRDPASYARYAPDIEQARQDLARKAYCSSRGDVRKDVYAFAVPFSRPVDGLQLVMNCGVLAARFSFAQAERQACASPSTCRPSQATASGNAGLGTSAHRGFVKQSRGLPMPGY
ncbi:hypothetical protein ET532_027830 [Verminephrobacter sp. Larva24]|nr:hypothetical protein ET532_027830 [Verminephrobacter sp. Larva24]